MARCDISLRRKTTSGLGATPDIGQRCGLDASVVIDPTATLQSGIDEPLHALNKDVATVARHNWLSRNFILCVGPWRNITLRVILCLASTNCQAASALSAQRREAIMNRSSLVAVTRVSALAAFTLFGIESGPAFARNDEWCSTCFVYDGEEQVGENPAGGATGFDMKFHNNCGVQITFSYTRQGEARKGHVFVSPGIHTDRCVGTRTSLCTPIVNYEWKCPPQPPGSHSTGTGAPKDNDIASRLKAAQKKADEAAAKDKVVIDKADQDVKAAKQQFISKKAQRDRDEAARKDKQAQDAADEARRRAKELEAQRNQAQLADAARWHCFPERSRCATDCRRLSNVAEQHGGDMAWYRWLKYCDKTCYTPNLNGQRCYRVPW